MLTCLVTGTAFSEQLPSKPFKVCPEVVKAKDTPCRVLGATASVVVRNVEREDPRDKELARLREENSELRKLLDSQLSKANESKKTEP